MDSILDSNKFGFFSLDPGARPTTPAKEQFIVKLVKIHVCISHIVCGKECFVSMYVFGLCFHTLFVRHYFNLVNDYHYHSQP